MSAKVNGLGHIGFYVQDLDLMKDFYGNFMGMTLTKGLRIRRALSIVGRSSIGLSSSAGNGEVLGGGILRLLEPIVSQRRSVSRASPVANSSRGG